MITPLDGHVTIGYKKAYDLKIPYEYVHVRKDRSTINLPSQIKKIFLNGGTIDDMIKLYDNYCVSIHHIIFLYIDTFNFVDLMKINRILIFNNLPYLRDDEALIESINTWRAIQGRMLIKTLSNYSRIKYTQELLNSVPSSIQQKLEINILKTTKIYQVIPQGNVAIDWNITSIKDIVDNAQVSQNVPFIQSPPIYKIFFNGNMQYDYNNFLFFTQDSKFSEDSLYAYVWSGKNINSKNSYNRCVYNSKNFSMEMTSNGTEKDLEDIRGHLEDTFIFFKFIHGETKSINAEITYTDVDINLNIFYFMIDQDPVMSSYLTIFERTNSRNNSSSVEMSWNNIISCQGNKTSIKFSQKATENNVLFVVNIISAYSILHVNEIGNIFFKLIDRYNSMYSVYADYVINELGELPEDPPIEYIIPTSKITALKDYQPIVFESNKYTRICQEGRQPIIISEDEIDSWKQMLIDGEERQIGEFPPRNRDNKNDDSGRLFHYICPHDETPWPSVNKNEDDSSVFPMLPCCGKKDRLTDYMLNNRGPFAKYYGDHVKKTKDKVFKSFGVIPIGSFGYIPNTVRVHLDMSFSIDDYISNVKSSSKKKSSKKKINRKDEDDESSDDDEDDKQGHIYMHYSVGGGEDSLIKCVIHATSSKETPQNIRIRMAQLHTSLYAQESVGIDEFNLRNMIINGYINPNILYRGLEEIFNINIYVINAQTEEMQLPNYNITHIRPFDYSRKSVLIWYHPDEEICELIVMLEGFSYQNKKNKISLFDTSMASRMDKTLNKSYLLSNNKIYDDIFHIINWKDVILNFNDENNLNWTFKSQLIDDNGKCRGFNVYNELTKVNISMYVYPCQPLNLNSSNFENTLITYDDAVSFMGEVPYSYSKGGVWFSRMAIDEYIFIAIRDDAPSSIKRSKSTSPYITSDLIYNQIKNIETDDEFSKMIVDLVWWSYLVEYRKNINIASMSSWISTNIKTLPYVDYTIIVPIQRLKSVVSSIDAFEYINENIPGFFDGKHVIFSEKNWSMIECYLYQKVKENDGLELCVPVYINKKYETENDFNQLSSKVFLSRKNFELWISNTSNMSKEITFTNSVGELSQNDIGLLKLNSGHMYIVQKEKNIKNAIYNSSQFKTTWVNNINTPFNEEHTSYVAYTLINNNLFIKRGDPLSDAEILEDCNNVYSLLRLKK